MLRCHWAKTHLFVVLLLQAPHCASVVTVATPQLQVPVSYSDLPMPTKRSFEVTETITYSGWVTPSPSSGNVYLEEIIRRQLAATPGARGVKNLRVRYYNPWISTFQFFNVFGYFAGVIARSGYFYGIVYRTKELEVSGDIY